MLSCPLLWYIYASIRTNLRLPGIVHNNIAGHLYELRTFRNNN